MKIIGFIGAQLRSALNEQRGFISADEISAAVWQASNAVFGHYAGHQGLLRPGQPLPATGYGLNDPVNTALTPFHKTQEYATIAGAGQMTWQRTGVIDFPVVVDSANQPTLENSFQRPIALRYPGARRVTQKNENQLAAASANSLTAPTPQFPIRVPRQGGQRVLPVADGVVLSLDYLCAPPRPVYAEAEDPDTLDMVYDDASSVDVGWTDVTAINEIIAHATRLLGGQVKDQQAVGIATQTATIGA